MVTTNQMKTAVYTQALGANVGGVVATAAAAAFFPLQPAVLFAALAVRIWQIANSLPYNNDSQHWCLHSDLTLLAALAYRVMSRRKRSTAAALTPREASDITSAAGATIRIQLLFVYAAAALFKANDGFMSPRTSCASIYMVQIAEQNLPPSLLRPGLLRAIVNGAPAVVLIVEVLVPLLLWLRPRWGVPFVAFFHTAIAITPPPNDIGSFGAQLLPRMLFFVPDEVAAAAVVDAAGCSFPTSAAVAAVAAVVTALQPKSWTGRFDWAVPICGGFAAIVTAAALSGRAVRVSGRARLPRSMTWTLCTVSFVYAFLLIPLGLLDVGNASPFSSLRKHGGSNHWFLPTGLLQRAFIDAEPDTLVGEAFGGGVVRVEWTNSSHLTGPRDILGVVAPEASQLLRESGHNGGQFSPNIFYGGGAYSGILRQHSRCRLPTFARGRATEVPARGFRHRRRHFAWLGRGRVMEIDSVCILL